MILLALLWDGIPSQNTAMPNIEFLDTKCFNQNKWCIIYDWRTKNRITIRISKARYLSFSKLTFFGRVKKYVFEKIRKQYVFTDLFKAGPGCILESPDPTDKLTTHSVKLSVAINDDLHHYWYTLNKILNKLFVYWLFDQWFNTWTRWPVVWLLEQLLKWSLE